jgi:hypothetical protein
LRPNLFLLEGPGCGIADARRRSAGRRLRPAGPKNMLPRRTAVALLAAAASAALAAPTLSAQTVPAGARIVVEVQSGVSGRDAERGRRPTIRVAEPLVLNGDTVVAVGAMVHTTVVDARGARTYGRPGTLHIAFDSTHTRAGDVVRLRGTIAIAGESRKQIAIVGSVFTYGLAGLAVRGYDVSLLPCHRFAVPTPGGDWSPVWTVRAPEEATRATCGADSASTVMLARHKSRATGLLLGILPGAGHVYAEEPGRAKAIGITATAGVSASMGILMVGLGGGIGRDSEDAAIAGMIAGAAISVGAWVFSMADAPFAVGRYNAREKARVLSGASRRSGSADAASHSSWFVGAVRAPRPGAAHAVAPALGLTIR